MNSETNNNTTAAIIYEDLITKYNDSSLNSVHLLNMAGSLIYGALDSHLNISLDKFEKGFAKFIEKWIETSEEKC